MLLLKVLCLAAQVASHSDLDVVAESWEDGPYMFILNIAEIKDKTRVPDPWSLQCQSHSHTHSFDQNSELLQ